MIRASPVRAQICRALLALALLAGPLALAGCNTDDAYQLPTRAMKELSPEMLALLQQKNMPKESPILVRIFKEESELEVWKQDTTSRFELLKVYPICRWSGELGPKIREGDRQAPEGFYTITPALMNPNSNYYLAINTGFPNTYDKANGRSGAFLMIHGDCSSRGCYAMTDEEIGEIYSLARESFLGGQQSFQIQAYPFRMTPVNLARHRTNPSMPFWRMIKEGNDHFEVTRQEPKVDVCDRRYVFDAQPPVNSTKPLVFNPVGRCPEFELAQEIAGPVREKERNDEAQFTQLSRFNVPVAPIKTGTDGGMNKVFLAEVEKARTQGDGRVHAPGAIVPDTTGAVADANASQPTLANRFFGGLFGSNKGAADSSTRVAATDSGSQERGGAGGLFGGLFSSNSSTQQANAAGALRGSEPATAAAAPQKAKPVAHNEIASAAGLRPKPKAEASAPAPRSEPHETAAANPKPAPQQEANAAAPAGNGVLNGAQPVVPAGSFDSRWGGLQ
ncbi:MAG TPA: murein L,D-transpeptidase family protein [Xanthobacteraceae bacterium]|nr:murein L,D-transpeptidase family protein [Xanthobacteraceae bacterium]